ncbi:MAG TPA: copper-containing nitrite reductase [Egicoccus sp.]|nr:copper-containing nitrite reductase [Egicoccus sp.]HSK23397.1 copper-containing nitrite reductase [Egicoccus sp.]
MSTQAPPRPPTTSAPPTSTVGSPLSGGRALLLIVAAVLASIAATMAFVDTNGSGSVVVADAAAADVDALEPGPRTADPVSHDGVTIPEPIGDRGPTTVEVELTTMEVEGQLADGSAQTYWTFNGSVPGPLVRVREGDTIEFTLTNDISSANPHSIDLHAVNGPGGGAGATQMAPGESGEFTFQALNPGVYVYHCATPHIPTHIAMGMYGLIVVEPEGGLPEVDREFYVMQGEIYTAQARGTEGLLSFDVNKMMAEDPTHVVFNGSVGALAGDNAMQAEVGETVRIYVGNGGPNMTSSFHVIGEIFDRASVEGGSLINENVQTTLVPAGGATYVEFELDVPGDYILVDHAITRAIDGGAVGILHVTGDDNPDVFDAPEGSSSGH